MASLRVAYAGTPDFAVPALDALLGSEHKLRLVITQPDRESGRGLKISKSAVNQSVSSKNVQIFQPENINEDSALSFLEGLNLDIIVVAAYGQLFTQRLLDLPKFGCINIHASLLPRWRGASPIQHAILAGDQESGVTIMQMQKAMDSGDIWFQSKCEIKAADTSQTLHDRLAALGGPALLKALDIIAGTSDKAIPQDTEKAVYCGKLKKSDGLINWNEPADLVLRRIRAFDPWPRAYTFFQGRRLQIIKAQSDGTRSSHPGEVLEVSKKGVVVSTGSGAIILNDLVPEGGKCVSAFDFSNANQLLGKTFGS